MKLLPFICLQRNQTCATMTMEGAIMAASRLIMLVISVYVTLAINLEKASNVKVSIINYK